jgi:hypothetical protein
LCRVISAALSASFSDPDGNQDGHSNQFPFFCVSVQDNYTDYVHSNTSGLKRQAQDSENWLTGDTDFTGKEIDLFEISDSLVLPRNARMEANPGGQATASLHLFALQIEQKSTKTDSTLNSIRVFIGLLAAVHVNCRCGEGLSRADRTRSTSAS